MERNPNDKFDSQNLGSSGGSGSSGAGSSGGYGAGAGGGLGSTGAGYGSTGAGSAGSLGSTGGAGMGTSGSGIGGEQSTADRARDTMSNAKDKAQSGLSTAKDKAQSGLSTAREKAGQLKNSLADKLDAGADRLRGQSGGGQMYAGAATAGDGSIGTSEGSMERVTGPLATGMHGTAEWLRENDLDSMKAGVEQQVRDHPGRTLLIAVGLGYVIGKAFRR